MKEEQIVKMVCGFNSANLLKSKLFEFLLLVNKQISFTKVIVEEDIRKINYKTYDLQGDDLESYIFSVLESENKSIGVEKIDYKNSFDFTHKKNDLFRLFLNCEYSNWKKIENETISLINALFSKNLGHEAFIYILDDLVEQKNTQGNYSYIYKYGEEAYKEKVLLHDIKFREAIDIEFNPGHSDFNSNYLMWFSKHYSENIPIDLLKTFEGAYDKEFLGDNSVRIQLYEDVLDYNNPVSRAAQWKFRKEMGLCEVFHKKANKTPPPWETYIDINKTEDNTWTVQRYFNDDWKPTEKVLATQLTKEEYDENGFLQKQEKEAYIQNPHDYFDFETFQRKHIIKVLNSYPYEWLRNKERVRIWANTTKICAFGRVQRE